MKNIIENLNPGIEADTVLNNLINNDPNSDVPQYSSTWEGVGLIAEVLETRGLMFSIQKTDENYECSVFDGHEADSLYVVQYSESAPHAFALAAIQALRQKSVVK